MDLSEAWRGLQGACANVAARSPAIAATLHDVLLDVSPEQGLARLLGRVLFPAWLSSAELVTIAQAEFGRSPAVVMAAMEDLHAITTRNLESGGVAWTWIGNRGFHVLVAHRVIHALWSAGSEATALAIKASLAPLGVDIHPAARFGRRIFLDHAVGLVVGETAVIEDDVSIWHGVTLGSTLMQSGDRHPKIRRGAIIGAGAIVLGNIEIGEGAIVASGSVVLRSVPAFRVVAGNTAAAKAGYRHPFGYPASSNGGNYLMSGTLGIDHPLLLVRDLEAMAAKYRVLGFNTAPTGKHPWGTSTSLMMFHHQALELMSVYDDTLLDSHAVGEFRFGRHMSDALAEREGVSLVALFSTDATGDRNRVEARGIRAQGRVDFRRKVKVPGRDWDEAVVTLEILVDPEMPRASNFLCQQHKPDLIWVPEWLEHPNGAVGFAGITYATAEPGRLLARMRMLFGEDAIRETDDGHEIKTANGVIRVVPPGLWGLRLGVNGEPDIAPASSACIGIDVRVKDLAVIRTILADANVAISEQPSGIALVDYRNYGNVLLRFVE